MSAEIWLPCTSVQTADARSACLQPCELSTSPAACLTSVCLQPKGDKVAEMKAAAPSADAFMGVHAGRSHLGYS